MACRTVAQRFGILACQASRKPRGHFRALLGRYHARTTCPNATPSKHQPPGRPESGLERHTSSLYLDIRYKLLILLSFYHARDARKVEYALARFFRKHDSLTCRRLGTAILFCYAALQQGWGKIMAALIESLFQSNDPLAGLAALIASVILVLLVRRAVSRGKPSRLN